MKTNYKVKETKEVKNKLTEKKVTKTKVTRKKKVVETPKTALANGGVVSFILVSKAKLCFRECAKIVKIAEDTNCLVKIASGTKSGTSESILSLVNLEIVADKSLVLTIEGERNEEAFRGISKIISGNAEEE